LSNESNPSRRSRFGALLAFGSHRRPG
jgi:hypothetical protein